MLPAAIQGGQGVGSRPESQGPTPDPKAFEHALASRPAHPIELEKTEDFSLGNAYSLAWMAELAYDDPGEIQETLSQWGFSTVRFIDNGETDTEGFVASNGEATVLAFRGSEAKWEDWGNNLRAWRTEGALEGSVHAGFHRALESVWGDVTSALAEVGGDDPALWIAGHSLGGGLATLAAAKLAEEGRAHEVAGVYTIGQPRVGSGAFADSYNEHYGDNTFRIVHNNDIVTRIPPLLSGYEHVGTQKYINHEGELDPDLGFWGRVWDRAQGRWDAIGESGSDGIADHDSGRYIEFLSRALELEGN